MWTTGKTPEGRSATSSVQGLVFFFFCFDFCIFDFNCCAISCDISYFLSFFWAVSGRTFFSFFDFLFVFTFFDVFDYYFFQFLNIFHFFHFFTVLFAFAFLHFSFFFACVFFFF